MGRRHAQALAAKNLAAWSAASPLCATCGQRLGKHRFGDDACPNPNWRTGNGQPQWKSTTYRDPLPAGPWA